MIPSRCSGARRKKAMRVHRWARGTFFRRVLRRMQEGETIDMTGFAPWMIHEYARAWAFGRTQ